MNSLLLLRLSVGRLVGELVGEWLDGRERGTGKEEGGGPTSSHLLIHKLICSPELPIAPFMGQLLVYNEINILIY